MVIESSCIQIIDSNQKINIVFFSLKFEEGTVSLRFCWWCRVTWSMNWTDLLERRGRWAKEYNYFYFFPEKLLKYAPRYTNRITSVCLCIICIRRESNFIIGCVQCSVMKPMKEKKKMRKNEEIIMFIW